jgi:NodT family efflux transporter outer membrane factor (OMF) lipoprotein
MSEPKALRAWRSWLPIGGALAVVLGGCATQPPQVLTPQLIPKRFVEPSPQTARVWPRARWWRRFDSPQLSRLIERAQLSNRDLAAAAARIQEARAEVTIQRSALFPQLDLQASAERIGEGSGALSSNVQGQPSLTLNSFGLNGTAIYSPDVWGLARDNLRSAEEGVNSARFAKQALALTVTADVADAYFNILALRAETVITKDDIAAIDAILNVVKVKVKAGTVSQLDLAQEQAQVESVRAQLPGLRQQEIAERAALAVLIGVLPENVRLGTERAQPIHVPTVRPGLPSALLLRRPDVAQAEANLAAAHANLQAARAAFLPQFALTGSAGFSSAAVNALLHGPSFLWDAGAQLVQTIFDGGRLIGQDDLAYATQKALVATYENAILNAYADVETALGQVRNAEQEETHLRDEVAAARQAFRIGELQYREGTAGLLTVLQTQQTLFAARNQVVQARLAHRQAVVHLYEALGGGWEEPGEDRTQFIVPPRIGKTSAMRIKAHR